MALIDSDKSSTVIPCSECQAGVMRRKYVTYFTWMGDDLISVPDFPAWVCDVCSRREFDQHALSRLELLLTPMAGKRAQSSRRISSTPTASKDDSSSPLTLK